MAISTSKDKPARFNNRQAFVNSFGAEFVVPNGVTDVYATLVAAGGRHGTANTAPISVGAAVAMAISANGRYTISSVNSGAPCDLLLADPVGRKLARRATSAAVTTAHGGYQTIALDNGFFITAGSATTGSCSLNAGVTVSADIGTLLTGYSTIAAAPIMEFAPTADVRACYVNSTTTTLTLWNGTNWTNGYGAYSGKSFASMSYANGFFIAGENNATSKTSLYYQTEALANTAAAWSNVVIDAVDNVIIRDVIYGGGLYVAVGAGGKIYTSATLGGTWTAQTSNTAQDLYAVKYANGRYVAIGSNGATTTSINGITWVATTASALARYRKDLWYWKAQSVWVLGAGASSTWYYSTDATSWTVGPVASTYGVCVTTAGLIYATGSATQFITTNPATPGAVLSTSNDGGNAAVSSATRGVLVSVAGGIIGAANVGGDGGSSTGTAMKGGQSATVPAQGDNGNGGITTTIIATGTGGPAGAANLYGGGGATLLSTVMEWLEGLFIPGAAGAWWTTSALSGGGGSALARGGVAGGSGMGPGGGQGSTTAGAGGGGEAVVRYKLTVTPGEILSVSTGLAAQNGAETIKPFCGWAALEW
ncbi:MAG: hypothetical protein Q8Q50_03495 [Methylobacter sp.]|nr:hypothetical protein [Methylobacter sp.]